MRTRFGWPAWVVAIALSSAPARAGEAEDSERARALFKEGAALVEQAEWSRALSLFEQSRAAREHALTVFNIGVCQRFLGRYTLARTTLNAALARNAQTSEMPALFVDQAKTYLAEIDQKVARVKVTLSPKEAAIAVDGRPLSASQDERGAWTAGIAAGGAGKSVGSGSFDVIVDPGSAVFTFTLEGHDTIELRRDLKPGATTELPVSMTEQSATIHVAADRAQAVVRLDDVDVGLAPVMVSRPPGTYQLTVSKSGFVTYTTKVSVRPGQTVRFDATLAQEPVPITKKWWFWTIGGVVVTGVGVTTFLLVRPAPTRPDVDKGGLNWAAEVR